jgi:acyl transferase domain-containing protein
MEVAGQLASPVRFRELIERMYADGVRTFIEVGPGSVVTGLVDDVLGDRVHKAYALDNKRANGVSQFLSTLGALSVAGVSVDYADLFEALPAEPPRPAPPKHAVQISGANFGKPYPPENGAAGRALPNPEKSQSKPSATHPSASPQTRPLDIPAPSFSASRSQEPAMADSSYSSFPIDPAGAGGETPAERVMMEVSRRHSDFLNMASAAHAAYLNTVAQVMGGAPASAPAPKALPVPSYASTPAPAAAPAPVQAAAQPAPAQLAPSKPTQPASGLVREVAPAAPKPAAPRPAPAAAPKAAPAIDAVALVRGIIADKTGYPEDMLDVDMDLEGELGVDSIKQVEILSTLREQMPELPEIDPERLVELRTIGAIADMVSGSTGRAPVAAPVTPAPAAAPAPSIVASPAAAPAGANGKISTDVVRALIADKTGYPADMLEDDMDLEGELGVDSIKQVEILSALRDQHPGLPEVDPEVLVELRSIRAIADFFA